VVGELRSGFAGRAFEGEMREGGEGRVGGYTAVEGFRCGAVYYGDYKVVCGGEVLYDVSFMTICEDGDKPKPLRGEI
jgi:hypothetical protein